MSDKTSNIKFEKAIQNLEGIVEKMESGELPLDKALTEFEKGISIAKQCQTALDSVEQKVQILLLDDTKGDFDGQQLDENA